MADYHLVSCEPLIAKIQDQLKSYDNSGLIDTGMLYAEIKLVTNQLGVAVYEMEEAIVNLDNYRTELPCNFYLLDSAWLCDQNPQTTSSFLQGKFTVFQETTNETICQDTACNGITPIHYNQNGGLIIQSTPCNNNNQHVLEKITIKEYVETSNPVSLTWQRPVLMTLKKHKGINGESCTSKCANLFAKSPYEISINREGFNKVLHSNLKDPTIYLKYYVYAEDPDTGLPLIPDEPILQRAYEYHLMYYLFYTMWLDSIDPNIERKVKDLEEKRDKYILEAKNYCKIPSFNKAVQMARNVRSRLSAYQAMDFKHY